jgi:MFS family permease
VGRTSAGDLRAVLAVRDFRRLFAVRMVSQAGDGVITAGVGTYVFFNASSFPSPAAGAAAFAVLYLPYSVVGPFAGVFIDRWSRRQILVWSALARAAFVVLTAVFMAAGDRGVPLYIALLLVLGVNRFFLSALSAALPHVVAEDELVMANSVSPTGGGITALIGGAIAGGLNVATGNTERGAAVTVIVGGACYVAASLLAATMDRDQLGPLRDEEHPPPGPLRGELALVARGLVAGARYLARRRGPAGALGATGAFSLMFGPLFLMSILLYRKYFYPSSAGLAEGHVVGLAIASGIGYAFAALVTPPAARRMSKSSWIAIQLVFSGIVTVALGETFIQAAYLALGFCLYLARQCVAISAVTIIQEEVDDVYRGRAFALYDMMYNVTYVAGAAIAAAFMAANGRSPDIIAVVAGGFAAAGVAYWLLTMRAGGHARPAQAESGSDPESGGDDGADGADDDGTSSPEASAQRSSS